MLLLSFRLNAQLNFLGNISVWGSAHNFILDFWKEKMSPKKNKKKKQCAVTERNRNSLGVERTYWGNKMGFTLSPLKVISI